MRYLRDTDYLFKIQQHDLDTLLDEQPNLILDSELKAQAEIELYLRKRYDLPQLFKIYPDYVAGLTYSTGSTVWYSPDSGATNYLYSPTASTTTLPSSQYWTQNDPRYPLIVEWMVNISLYKLHCRVAPDNVPTQRNDQYQATIAALKMIRDEKVSTDFPEIAQRVQNIYITGSTSTQRGMYLW